MKLPIRGLCLFAVLVTGFANAQQGAIQHIIVVVQENRTPDNLFQDPNLIAAGADIVAKSTGGPCYNQPNHMDVQVPLITRPLKDCVNPDHSHAPAWNNSYRAGHMDGACQNIHWGSCSAPPPACPTGSGQQYCPQYAYVDNSTAAGTPIQPYWDIAEKYGFANYMFQTSQGPSFPAHQFLLSGTSSPDAWGIPFYTTFAAENTHSMQDAGCAASSGTTVPLVDSSNVESTTVYPCFEHATLTDLLDQKSITWRYYSDQANSIWTAPNAIGHICNNGGAGCGSPSGNQDWNTKVQPFLETNNHLAPFLNDLKNCSLAQVTWVVPDGRWSDHPVENLGLGPDYVANIVNAVGQGMPNSTCNPLGNPIYWNNTVILITWDDWGGWYDHVNPNTPTGPGIGYPNSTGGQYVYGFRVPLLVVSTYGKPSYISGPQANPTYYDFGSILKFIENTFLPPNTFINPVYPYADQFVDISTRNADLSDFFTCFTQACRHAFQPITLVNNSQFCKQSTCGSNQCDAACFINYTGSPKDPDDE